MISLFLFQNANSLPHGVPDKWLKSMKKPTSKFPKPKPFVSFYIVVIFNDFCIILSLYLWSGQTDFSWFLLFSNATGAVFLWKQHWWKHDFYKKNEVFLYFLVHFYKLAKSLKAMQIEKNSVKILIWKYCFFDGRAGVFEEPTGMHWQITQKIILCKLQKHRFLQFLCCWKIMIFNDFTRPPKVGRFSLELLSREEGKVLSNATPMGFATFLQNDGFCKKMKICGSVRVPLCMLEISECCFLKFFLQSVFKNLTQLLVWH